MLHGDCRVSVHGCDSVRIEIDDLRVSFVGMDSSEIETVEYKE